jgi:hypothetical protein
MSDAVRSIVRIVRQIVQAQSRIEVGKGETDKYVQEVKILVGRYVTELLSMPTGRVKNACLGKIVNLSIIQESPGVIEMVEEYLMQCPDVTVSDLAKYLEQYPKALHRRQLLYKIRERCRRTPRHLYNAALHLQKSYDISWFRKRFIYTHSVGYNQSIKERMKLVLNIARWLNGIRQDNHVDNFTMINICLQALDISINSIESSFYTGNDRRRAALLNTVFHITGVLRRIQNVVVQRYNTKSFAMQIRTQYQIYLAELQLFNRNMQQTYNRLR